MRRAYQSSPKKVLFIANTDWYLFNFRYQLIEDAEAEGWSPVLVCTRGRYADRLAKRGWPIEYVDFPTTQFSVQGEAKAFGQIARVIRRHRPAVVHLFTLKCVLYGTLAGRLASPQSYYLGALTGLGYLFSASGRAVNLLKNTTIKALKIGLKSTNSELIFQNEADREEFLRHKIIAPSHSYVIRGSGVNLDEFYPDPRAPRYEKPLRLLFCGRLIEEKGIRDYLAAIAIARERGSEVHSMIAGAPYPGNPSSLTEEEIETLKAGAEHEFLGHQDDMATLFRNADVVVLPTYYREGTPRSLLEALASGCIIITSTIAACDDIVDEGKNGFRVAPRSPDSIAEAIRRLDQYAIDELKQMGAYSTQVAAERFASHEVNRKTIELYG